VTVEEARAHLGLETQRHWSDQALARTTPVLLALVSLVTLLAWKRSQDGNIPVPMTGLVSHGRADVLRRSARGTLASLACPLCGELYG
jgi:hypothetical protein